ncbi:4HBT domain-containing protein [Cephalotus follicularis]|uniref:4HBT domain-containing protein n=1 Tax=Cephalotus follicularis TaxID=3775 RepID=A0A1Q3CZI6_CEPFO|nr:4HBT domain-containing protein [Cephalotus follicularis]
MAKATTTSQETTTPTVSKHLSPEYATGVVKFLENVGILDPSIHSYNTKDYYSHLISGHLRADHVQRGRITCLLSVTPAVTNYFNGLHGGAVAAFAERVAIACAKTVVGDDKEIFLGELSISYLSSARQNEELIVDGSVVRSGRNLTMVSIEFKVKETGKLVYTARATFYNFPVSKL